MLDATEENIQARIRGNILMALSNKFGWLVLTTGNKSEMGVGYAALYGDMAGGFAVIKDVPKTLVYDLAHYRNSLVLQPHLSFRSWWIAKSTTISRDCFAHCRLSSARIAKSAPSDNGFGANYGCSTNQRGERNE